MPRAKQDRNPPAPHTRRDADQSKQRESRRANRHAVDSTDFSGVSPELIARAVVAVTRDGCAIQFGLTRDGSALVIRIVGDGPDAYSEYVRPSENADLYFEGLIEDFGNRT